MPYPRASLTRWNGVTHAIVDILVVDGSYVDVAEAKQLARITNKGMTVRLTCGIRVKYHCHSGNRITGKPVTCLWCGAERNL